MVDSAQLGNGAMIEQLLGQARTAVARANWPLAEDRLRRVHAARPADLAVARLLGQVLRELGRSGEAEVLLVRSYKEADAGAEGHEARRDLLLELADLRLADGRPAEAARVLHRVLSAEPSQWEALRLLGDAFLDSGHAVEAASAYRESISSNPFEAETWWNLGTALERAGDMAAAAAALEGWLGLAGDVPEREQVIADIARLRAGEVSGRG